MTDDVIHSTQYYIEYINRATLTNLQRRPLKLGSLRADLHGTIFLACDNGLRQAHDMIYDRCVRQKKCRSLLNMF